MRRVSKVQAFTFAGASMGLVLLGIWAKSKFSVKDTETERKKKLSDIELSKTEVDETARRKILDEIINQGLNITEGFKIIAKDIILDGEFTMIRYGKTKKTQIVSISEFLEEFVRRASTVYITDLEGLRRIPRTEEDILRFINKHGLKDKFSKMIAKNRGDLCRV